MDHFVPLDKLPEGYQFPPDMADRIRFDNQAKRLLYHGYMSKADFDRMCQHTSNWSFRRKLEDLFQICEFEQEVPARGLRRLFSSFRHRDEPR